MHIISIVIAGCSVQDHFSSTKACICRYGIAYSVHPLCFAYIIIVLGDV
jgi:hypothetical protein